MNMDEPAPSSRNSGTKILLGTIRSIDRLIEYLEVFIVAGSILGMAGIMVTHVVGRTFFQIGIPGTTEIVEILILLITFVGLSYAARRARHISMSAVYDQLSGNIRKAMLILICVVTGSLLFFMAWESAGYVEAIYGRGRATSALQIPLWIVYMAMPVGFTLAGIQYWLTAFRNLTTQEIYRSFTEREIYEDVPEGNETNNDNER